MPIPTCVLALCCTIAFAPQADQPALGHRRTPILTVDGLQFKDLNRNGKLDPYEDWRLTPEARTADLVSRMTLEELAGVMVHGTLPSFGTLGVIGIGSEYDLATLRSILLDRGVNTFITRLNASPAEFAVQNNHVQELAETSRLGIPVTISTDPRSHFQQVLGASGSSSSFSLWPEPVGFAALRDPAVTRQFADDLRQEYLAVGIRESLAPQADLATEPRWPRLNGTFGSNSELVSRLVQAYVEGIQNGCSGLNSSSVAAVVKHWVGYGAAKDGWDSHNFYGRFASYDSHSRPDALGAHIAAFNGAFAANVAAVMPTYSILQGATLDGKPLEQVGAGFSQQLLTDLLRGRSHFTGVLLSDWKIIDDCNANCHNGASAGLHAGPEDIGMPWGVEGLTPQQRVAKAINAGVDQIGGTDEPQMLVADVHAGFLTRERLQQSAARILLQKFQLGLFEQPFVDPSAAGSIVGNAGFVEQGESAQARAVVLLKNNPIPGSSRPVLPLHSYGVRVFLVGMDAKAARAAGFTVVSKPAQAQLAIVHAAPPFESQHPGFFFGSIQHEGRLDFVSSDPAYAALLQVSRTVPTVFITTLERPLILTNVLPYAAAVLGDFGIDDRTLLDVLTGKRKPEGALPFELPSSEEAVRNQASDLSDDSAHPLFPYGFGLRY